MTTQQLTLDLQPLATPTYTPSMSLAQRYAAWAAVNGHVVDAMESLAAQWFAAGNVRRVSMRLLWERLRWESGISVTAQGAYKLDNNWPPFIARELVSRHPVWREYISLRTSAADEVA